MRIGTGDGFGEGGSGSGDSTRAEGGKAGEGGTGDRGSDGTTSGSRLEGGTGAVNTGSGAGIVTGDGTSSKTGAGDGHTGTSSDSGTSSTPDLRALIASNLNIPNDDDTGALASNAAEPLAKALRQLAAAHNIDERMLTPGLTKWLFTRTFDVTSTLDKGIEKDFTDAVPALLGIQKAIEQYKAWDALSGARLERAYDEYMDTLTEDNLVNVEALITRALTGSRTRDTYSFSQVVDGVKVEFDIPLCIARSPRVESAQMAFKDLGIPRPVDSISVERGGAFAMGVDVSIPAGSAKAVKVGIIQFATGSRTAAYEGGGSVTRSFDRMLDSDDPEGWFKKTTVEVSPGRRACAQTFDEPIWAAPKQYPGGGKPLTSLSINDHFDAFVVAKCGSVFKPLFTITWRFVAGQQTASYEVVSLTPATGKEDIAKTQQTTSQQRDTAAPGPA